MQFATVTREEADKAYIIVRNREASSITQNMLCGFDQTTSFDGLWAMQGNTSDLNNMAGVADANIATNDYGRVQCWGYRASIYTEAGGSSVTITKGDMCGLVASNWGTNSIAAAFTRGIVAGETATVSAATYIKGFLRCV